jgi:hypothetical protein
VLTAIRNNQFWILTHSDFDPMIRARVDAMLAREEPASIAEFAIRTHPDPAASS